MSDPRSANVRIHGEEGLLTDHGSFGTVCAPLKTRRGFHEDSKP